MQRGRSVVERFYGPTGPGTATGHPRATSRGRRARAVGHGVLAPGSGARGGGPPGTENVRLVTRPDVSATALPRERRSLARELCHASRAAALVCCPAAP